MPLSLQIENVSGFLNVTDTLTQEYFLKYTYSTLGILYTPPI